MSSLLLDTPSSLPLETRWLQDFLAGLKDYADPSPPVAPVRLSLLDFVEQAWPIIEPRAQFVHNWHIEAIATHLMAITYGEINDLLINVPPGTMKSVLVSIMWPAWEWTLAPHLRYLCGSYDEQLSIRDNRKMRDIVESDWYQARWPLQLRPDQNTKTRYDNEHSGWRIGTSVGGRGTGEHPHRKIVDDPHNVKESLSDVQRQEALDWFSLTLSSRGAALGAATVVIMQRLHERDLSGHILDTMPGVFTHLCLPMRYEPPAWVDLGGGQKALKPRMPVTPLGFQDPRTVKGELLWPALLPESTLHHLETQLRSTKGEYGVAGQYQQRPVPETGGMFKREWFRIVDALPADAQVIARCRFWDCASTEKAGDWTVGARLAYTTDGRIFVEDIIRGQWGPDQFEGPFGIMRQTATLDGRRVRIREEQEGGSSGKKVIAAHAKLLVGYDFKGEPPRGDKPTRARPFAAQCSVGNVWLVRAPWNGEFISEFVVFDAGVHDDQVDAASGAFNEIALGKTISQRAVTGY
jgi:predicted phage terminase large subunit-like protein